jgi:Fe-S-cluster containining protein
MYLLVTSSAYCKWNRLKLRIQSIFMKQNSANIQLKIAGNAVEVTVTVPDKPVKQEIVLPFLRELDQKAEDIAVERVLADGEGISCSKGCSACCYQLIPLSPVEARYLVALVDRLPKNRKRSILTRFEEVYKKFESAGLLSELMNSETIQGNVTDFALKYFRLSIPCPFLENESCSIYKDRPLRCREYLVSNPAINCRNPSKETIRLVPFTVRTSEILTMLNKPWTEYANRWVPLALTIAWVKQHPEQPVLRHSKHWIEDALHALS